MTAEVARRLTARNMERGNKRRFVKAWRNVLRDIRAAVKERRFVTERAFPDMAVAEYVAARLREIGYNVLVCAEGGIDYDYENVFVVYVDWNR